MKNSKLKVQSLDDIIFELRNKEYGAYFLRTNYGDHLRKAAVLGVSTCLLMIGSAWGYAKYNDKHEEIITTTSYEHKLQEVPDEPVVIPPKIEEILEEIVEVAEVEIPIFEPKLDEEVIKEITPPTQAEIDKSVISSRTKDGTDVVGVFTPPPPPAITVEEKITGKIDNSANTVFTRVEQNPEFPGGELEMMKYIASNINYPAPAQRTGTEGIVFVQFIVEKDGSISGVKALKGIGFGCDEESLRVIKSMPKWNPGKQNGTAVRVYFTIPVRYQLN